MAPTMVPESPADGHAIDPISRHILQRTITTHKVLSNSHSVPAGSSITQSDGSDGQNAESEVLPKGDTHVSVKTSRDKKKGVSFLSRIMGGKKKEVMEPHDSVSEITEDRSSGYNAEVFSHPVGYIPNFPAPPRYIRVKAQNRKKRDLERLFLAQILLNPSRLSRRKSSDEVDSKIVGIGDTPSAAPQNSSRKANNAIWAAEFSKDGKYFAAAGQDKKLRVWEVILGKEGRDASDDISQSGSENEQNVRVDAPVFKQRLIREYDGHTAAILDLSWSKNNFILTSSMDKSVRLYHVTRQECLCSFKHNDFVTSVQFHPRDDRFFLAGSLDSKVRLWSIPDKNIAYWAQVPDMVTAVAFTPDGKTAIAGCLSGLCILYNTDGMKAHSQIHVRSSRGRNTKGSKITGIDTIALPQADGHSEVKLLITSNDSRIRMYNLRDRALEMKFRGNENSCSQIRASFSDDGKFVICGSEDRKVYVWPTGPVEKSDMDKRPVEIFEAHEQIVTTALFAPTAARRILAQSGDPIYDLCNPPPVVLISRTDSVLSSPSLTQQSASDEAHKTPTSEENESPRKVIETPAYKARHDHKSGFIIVTADYSGQIKVFRQDCAFQKRRDNIFDSNSNLSRKMHFLGRSGSTTTRGSTSTSHNSLHLSNGGSSSTDRINNWRESVMRTPSVSNSVSNSVRDGNTRQTNAARERSTSPRKTASHRLSVQSNSQGSSYVPATSRQPPATPELTIQSPTAAFSHPFDPSNDNGSNGMVSPQSTVTVTPHKTKRSSTISSSAHAAPVVVVDYTGGVKATPDNPLVLVDDHSYMAWDMQNSLAPMARAQPRTPGALSTENHNPISRTVSVISKLSSELGSSGLSSHSDTENNRASAGGMARAGSSLGLAGTLSDNGDEQEEELKCRNCGSEKFRMVKVPGGGRGLKCRECGSGI